MYRLLFAGLVLAVPCAAQLRVINGAFGNTNGLKAYGGHGWFQGVPAGWRSSARSPIYSVHAGGGGTQMVCNVSVLGRLEQRLGVVERELDVVLTLDVADSWGKGAELNVEVVGESGETLARAGLRPGLAQRVVAENVPAETPVTIRFAALHGTTPGLDNVAVSVRDPVSPGLARLEIRRFQPDPPLVRARRVAAVSAEVATRGSSDVTIRPVLSLPNGVHVVKSSPAEVRIPADEGRTRLSWEIEAEEPGAKELRLELRTEKGALVAVETLRMWVLPAVARTSPEYIPAPVPAPARMLVGAHHCPLWEADKPQMWLNVLKHPERTPALGFYAQENPEVADWETKWAVEHGISFFIYCWYRTSQGGAVRTQFGSAIHDALFKSRFADKMKFTLMWENQSRGKAGVADERDLFTNLLPWWMENYFKHPGYLKVDNKPVLFIYRPEFLVQDLGGVTNVAKAFDRMREVCRAAGFDGLYLLGEYRGTDARHLALMRSLGLDYTFAYCWPVPDSPLPERAMSVQMEHIRKTGALGILPQVVTVSQAWSGWRDEGSIWKIPPAQFETLLRQAKGFATALPTNQLGSRMLLLDNWNEWGEGHYIAPYREHGFGYLDAVRNVFTSAPAEHTDLLPEDVGRGPYDRAMRAHFAAEEEKQRLASKRVAVTNVPPGLVAWWTFDDPEGSAVALDYSGHRNGGFLEGARRATGFAGRALVCDGASVLVPRSASLAALQTFTVECRAWTDMAGQDNRWMINGVFGHSATSGFRLGLLRGKPCFQVPRTEWSHHLSGDEILAAGQWVHLAATFDGTTMRLYMNGRLCGEMERTGELIPAEGRLVLGNYDVGHRSRFEGLLDEARVYRRALGPEEIRAHAAGRW